MAARGSPAVGGSTTAKDAVAARRASAKAACGAVAVYGAITARKLPAADPEAPSLCSFWSVAITWAAAEAGGNAPEVGAAAGAAGGASDLTAIASAGPQAPA